MSQLTRIDKLTGHFSKNEKQKAPNTVPQSNTLNSHTPSSISDQNQTYDYQNRLATVPTGTAQNPTKTAQQLLRTKLSLVCFCIF
ncbi:hypothetical protein JTE90_016799 [Oedothorax gibbosus]|uniref:Uncharacterized protein n=1 Tax=Oedothorax gibbosus TaxID=931172 RepID=A0AAV6VXJ4_9ARAC|nr:hypothetical protein JTE90_016799 [Oedothorax gibbosus]